MQKITQTPLLSVLAVLQLSMLLSACPQPSGSGLGSMTSCNSSDAKGYACLSNSTSSSSSSGSLAPGMNFDSGQAAVVEIGQPDWVTADYTDPPTANELDAPWGNCYVNDGILYIPDQGNSRILGYNSIPTENNPTADFVIGFPNFNDDPYDPGYGYYGYEPLSPPSASSLNNGQTIGAYNGQMAVIDPSNNRALIYGPVPTSNGPSAILEVGQPVDEGYGYTGFNTKFSPCNRASLASPQSMYFGNGKLIIADTGNNRIMIYNSIPVANGAEADLVLGQGNSGTDADFESCNANAGDMAPSASTMSDPNDVWTDGTRLIVTDTGNNRILIWSTFPTANGQPANIILGQVDPVSGDSNMGGSPSKKSLYNPGNVYSNGTQLFLTDSGNNRVLIWNHFPTSSTSLSDTSADPDVVLGQSDFESGDAVSLAPPPAMTGLSFPNGIYVYGTQLFVTDLGNSRVLIFQGHQ